jgi:formylglycine-generating enzyme required for sulfatase activity
MSNHINNPRHEGGSQSGEAGESPHSPVGGAETIVRHLFTTSITKPLASFLESILSRLGDDWWRRHVVSKLNGEQQKRLKERDIQTLAGLDLPMLLCVLGKNLYLIPNQLRPKDVRHSLDRIKEIRNRWAHTTAEEQLADDVDSDLNTLWRFAEAIGADEAVINELQETFTAQGGTPHSPVGGAQMLVKHLFTTSITKPLASFLKNVLPRLNEEYWWPELVVSNLSTKQQQFLDENTSLTGLGLPALLCVLYKNWNSIFTLLSLPKESINFGREMQTIRDRWAHIPAEEPPAMDIWNDLNTMQRFAAIIGADETVIRELQDAKAALRPPAATPSSSPSVTSEVPSNSDALSVPEASVTVHLDDGQQLKLRYVAPGDFTMGSPESEKKRKSGTEHYGNETQCRVSITKYYRLGETPVTQAQWEAVMGKKNDMSSSKDALRPVKNISWDDAMAFCDALTKREAERLPEGYRYTLPTEAQWEYACRAGTTTPFNTGDKLTERQANYGSNETTDVKKYPANDWGFYDMHGNVWEWCLDWYGDYPSSDTIDPTGPESGCERIHRGGSWRGSRSDCRSATRHSNAPGRRLPYYGFRVALAPK